MMMRGCQRLPSPLIGAFLIVERKASITSYGDIGEEAASGCLQRSSRCNDWLNLLWQQLSDLFVSWGRKWKIEWDVKTACN